MCIKLIKNSQPFGKKFQKTIGGDLFDSHCITTQLSHSAVYFLHKECSTEVIPRELTSKFYIGRPHQCLHLLITWKF